jgi:hypothetical protein
VWVEMPFMRGPIGAQRLREWLPEQRQIRERTAARRERVLAHEWARKRICRILGHTDAAKWNGYIPPATRASDGKVDDNPIRDALIQLLHEVEDAERPPIHVGDITPVDTEQLASAPAGS